MNSMPQQAVTNGYRNIEYLRPQLSTASTVVVMNESPPWRRNSSARASFTRFASSRETGLGIALRIESTGIVRSGSWLRPRWLLWTIARDGEPRRADLPPDPPGDGVVRAAVHGERRGARGVRALGDRARRARARGDLHARGARDRLGGRHARAAGRRGGAAAADRRAHARRRRRLSELLDRARRIPARAGFVRPLDRRNPAR